MSEPLKQEPAVDRGVPNLGAAAEESLTGVAPPDGNEEHKKRTWGNKIFDLAVWPTIAFGAVYALSTWVVKAAKQDIGSPMNRFHEGLASRLESVAKVQAKESHNLSLVLMSFAVGTALMAPIKWLEDARGKISHWIDRKLDTAPADPTHYAKEPKQTWKSVLGGRLVTFLSVLGISFAVGEKRTEKITDAASAFVQRQWKKLKRDVSEKSLEKVHEWTKANAFEMFYTTLCAVMVYALSRTFARHLNKREQETAPSSPPPAESAPAADPAAAKSVSWQDKAATREKPEKTENYLHAVDKSRAGLSDQPAVG